MYNCEFKLTQLIKDMTIFVLKSQNNVLKKGICYYEPPLVGVARAEDPLFLKLKQENIVGKAHLSPSDWLPGAKSVIAYFLPYSREIRESNYRDGYVSDEWLHARFHGEDFNNDMRHFLIERLESLGAQALAPVLEEDYHIDYTVYGSNWSEKHVAFVAGLGTFGLNRALITKRGSCGRLGSVITSLKIDSPEHRKTSNIHEYCFWFRDGSCGDCIKRCPAEAINSKGMDKSRCREYLLNSEQAREIKEKFNYAYNACGKCLTNVPCEDCFTVI